jgi:16S rRNA (cytosine1402-N4)-methyltransferase
LLGVDQDPEAIAIARERLTSFGRRVRIRQGRMSGLSRLIRKEQIEPPIGVLFDIGVSSMQLDVGERGFSFQVDGPLDMRMDPTRDRTAADIVNQWDEGDLADLFFHEGGEHRARRVARAIVEGRRRAPFLRTLALADVVARAVGEEASSGRIHPATKTFQALRRAVNEEGEELLGGLAAAMHWLADGGRLVVITFHSGEDGEVKRFLADAAKQGEAKLVTKRPLVADRDERHANPRARSAHLRAAERTRTGPAGNGSSHWDDRGDA